jgi:small acid-soluble spore protein (thioredoxin-like protein)
LTKLDKVAHLQEHIDHTIVNLQEAEEYLDKHEDEITSGKQQVIEAKNDRRVESIKGFATKINHEVQ